MEKFLNLDKLNLENYHDAETKTGGNRRRVGRQEEKGKEGWREMSLLNDSRFFTQHSLDT